MHEISVRILEAYPANKAELRIAHQAFEWRGQFLDAGWKERCALSKELNQAIEKSLGSLSAVLHQIHRWGLAGRPPISISENIEEIHSLLLEAKKGLTPQVVVRLLSFRGLGIATISKWVCLLDQKRNGIFDSRVSVALREVRNSNGERYFPVLPSRKIRRWPDDRVSSNEQMAIFYMDYLEGIRAVREKVDLEHAAEVEMALFMIGNKPCNDRDGWRKLRGPLRKV